LFAVGVPALLAVGAETEQQQQQQQQKPRQQQQQQCQGLVLVFSPSSPQPLLASPIANSSPTSLLYMPATPASSSSSSSKMLHMSPLLLLTSDRRYSRLTAAAETSAAAGQPNDAAAAAAGGGRGGSSEGLAAVPGGIKAAMEAEKAAGADESALEAMFGKMDRLPGAVAAAGGMEGGAAAAAEQAAAIKQAVNQLFDAPSHVLPPPSTLCPTFLELLLGSSTK
jgi:NET1-associated nuclear protein 1 (U3 small nucleolar RNA-associated protein 17)